MIKNVHEILQERILELILSGAVYSLETTMDIVHGEYMYTREAISSAIYELSDKWYKKNDIGKVKEPLGLFQRYQLYCYDAKGKIRISIPHSDIDKLLDIYSKWKKKDINNTGRIAKIDITNDKVLDILLDDYETKEEEGVHST